MRKLRKILMLPVLAVGSASLVLVGGLGVSAAPVVPPAAQESVKVTDESVGGAALTVTNWTETAGMTKGNPGGPNGTKGCPIIRKK